ncbi:hypothetical protein [Nocardia sp. NPDC057353]|uniref:hypothetical protein n=1 Tax=Nocardia sp. NPDC057353 TaxID=3346104 RepID=UPI00363A79C0
MSEDMMGIGSSLFGKRRTAADAEREFGERALALVRAQPGVVQAEFDADEFVITYRTATGPSWIGLTTVWRRAAGRPPAHAQRILEQFVLAGMHGIRARGQWPGWAEVAPHLRPLLRQAGQLDARIEGIRLGDQLLWRPVLPMLIEQVVIDAPETMASVTAQHLDDWGVDAATVFETARANMAGLAQRFLDLLDPTARDVMHVPDADGELYAGSLPLAPGWLHGAGLRYRTQPLVFVPGNVGVLLGFASSPGRVAELVHAARELYEEAVRPVSPVPYTVGADGGLVPYAVPEGHPAWAPIRSAESALAAAVYRDQYGELRADSPADDSADLAAEILHIGGRDGVEFTMATWTDGVPTLLPRVHAVMLTDLRTGAAVPTRWEALAREVPLEPVPGRYPPRYRVRHHPHPDAMRRLAAAAPH